MKKLSICIPVYNSAKTIEALVRSLHNELQDVDFEIVLVNDASPKDNSEYVCSQLAREYENVKFIGLRKNYGEHNAIMCALAHSSGEYVVTMDDDFQNPPSEITKLWEMAKTGVDVVYSQFEKKRHHWFRNFGSWFNNIVATWLLEKPRNLYLSSFKVISRDVVNEILKYSGPFPYVDGLILRVTNSFAMVRVEHSKRVEGKSNYTLKKLIALWLRMFINFSQKPLRIAISFGLIFAVISIVLAIIFALEKIIDPDSSRGWASLIVSVLFMGSIQLIFLGLLGEYIGKIYLDINGNPQWTIKIKID